MSQITDESLREAITQRLQATHVEVTDMSGAFCPFYPANAPRKPSKFKIAYKANHDMIHTGGCGQAFTSLIVSPQFVGLNSLKRHRVVNAALKDEIAIIHAWTAKCQTPEEHEKSNAEAARVQAEQADVNMDGEGQRQRERS